MTSWRRTWGAQAIARAVWLAMVMVVWAVTHWRPQVVLTLLTLAVAVQLDVPWLVDGASIWMAALVFWAVVRAPEWFKDDSP